MSDALSFAEIDRQHVELLPARTVLSTFSAGGGPRGGGTGTGTGMGAPGVTGGEAEASASHFYSEGDVLMIVTGGAAGTGGAAQGGGATGGAGVAEH
jgi:hypothetical protein